MGDGFHIGIDGWQGFLNKHSEESNIYAPVKTLNSIDYTLIDETQSREIVYNIPKPVTPLKLFFLPVHENVTKSKNTKRNIIIGIPSCDLAALSLLDEIYLQEPFIDEYYKNRRKNTLLIGTDCYETMANCHCTSYGIHPFPESNHDLSLSYIEGDIFLFPNTKKGVDFIDEIWDETENITPITRQQKELIEANREIVQYKLEKENKDLPSFDQTGELIAHADSAIWRKYSQTCVSCGGCATICPTCSCFLLVDRPGFEKIRQMDACQYPGFARIAAGEDHLNDRAERFKNRFLCKYVWKKQRFNSPACTGCGRCIDVCIGRINKNELFVELASQVMA